MNCRQTSSPVGLSVFVFQQDNATARRVRDAVALLERERHRHSSHQNSWRLKLARPESHRRQNFGCVLQEKVYWLQIENVEQLK